MAGVASHDDCGLRPHRRRVLEGIFEVLPAKDQGEPGVVVVSRGAPGLPEQVAQVLLALRRRLFRTSEDVSSVAEVCAATAATGSASVSLAP